MRRGIAALAMLGGLLAAAPSEAATVTERYGPVRMAPYEVARGDEVFNIPKPQVDGFITHMQARLVYADGTPVPIANTMLHHVVMLDTGRYVGDKQDPTCDAFRRFDSETFLPLRGLRFYGLGEERHELVLPDGYGYPTRADDRWAMTYMLMNHRPKSETVFIEYTMELETAPLKPVTPVWLDVRDCNLDPVYDVAGGARRGTTTTETATWSPPAAGRIVATAGHVHGGGRELRLTKPGCGGQLLARSRPSWGRRSHPYYQVRPLLHEPGPISMSNMTSAQGIPVAAGERLKLSSVYDAHRPHARVMGIMLLAFAPDPSVTERCAPLPADERTFFTQKGGRKRAPRIRVPITTWDGYGRAQVIRRPPGATTAVDEVDVRGLGFHPANIVVRRGRKVRWHFFDEDLHNVTFANGPAAFSSANRDAGGVFAHRFRRRGVYRLMCTLHPVEMAATVRVRR